MPELHLSVQFGNITFRFGNLFHVFVATRLQKLKLANQSNCTTHTEEADASGFICRAGLLSAVSNGGAFYRVKKRCKTLLLTLVSMYV